MVEQTLGELAESGSLAFGDGYRTKRSEHGCNGFRILRVADVTDGTLRPNGGDFVREEFSRAIGSKLSEPGDVLLTTKGSIGRVAIVPKEVERLVYSPQLCYFRIRDERVLNRRYLAYWLKSEEFGWQASYRANSTDMAAYISLRDLRSVRIKLPRIDEQNAIAEVLGALDAKIAANDRAQVAADLLLAARFAQLVDGCHVVRLSTLAVVNQAAVRPDLGGSLRYIDISSVGCGGYVFPARSSWADAPSRARRVVKAGDTIWSTVRPNRRSHALVLDDDPLLVASTGLAVLSPRAGHVAGLYEATRCAQFVAYLESVAEGSAYPAVRSDRFSDAPIPDLSTDEWSAFEAFAGPLRRRMHAAQLESRALAATRDELLPLLMSGRLRVKDAARVVEEVV